MSLFGYRQFYGNLCTPLSAFGPAFYVELAAQKGNPFPHSGQTEGFPLRQCLFHVESNTVIFHDQLEYSIGRYEGNIYQGCLRSVCRYC